MRRVTLFAAQIALALFMWTSVSSLMATALGRVTLALSVLIVLWAIA